MSTKYNLTISANVTGYSVSDVVLNDCLDVVKDFIGEKHVNHFGKVFDGHDSSSSTHYRGRFDILIRDSRPFYKHMNVLEDKIKIQRLLVDGDTQNFLDETLLEAKRVEGLIEYVDPKIMIYGVNQFMNETIPNYQAIDTPVGRQDTHIHVGSGSESFIIPFIKPENDNHFYDFDQLRAYLHASSALYSILNSNDTNQMKRKERNAHLQTLKLLERITSHEIIMFNPADVKKISIPDSALDISFMEKKVQDYLEERNNK